MWSEEMLHYESLIVSKTADSSQVYLSLFGFSVFAFTLDICFYFKNTKAEEHWRLKRFRHVSTEFKIIQLKI